VTKLTTGLERLCADLRRHPVKAHTRHLFLNPLLTWFVLAPKSLQGGTLEAGASYRLYPRSTSAKNPHHLRQLSLTFDLSCMGPKSSPIPSDEYHSQDLVHGIGEKPSSTDSDSPCRADTPKERSHEVGGKVIGSRVCHVAFAVAVFVLLNHWGINIRSRGFFSPCLVTLSKEIVWLTRPHAGSWINFSTTFPDSGRFQLMFPEIWILGFGNFDLRFLASNYSFLPGRSPERRFGSSDSGNQIFRIGKLISTSTQKNTPRFQSLLLGKETVKTFFYKCSNSGRKESTPQTQSNVSWISSKAELEISFMKLFLYQDWGVWQCKYRVPLGPRTVK